MDDAADVPARPRRLRASGAVPGVLVALLALSGAVLGAALAPGLTPAGLPAWQATAAWRGGPPLETEWPRAAVAGESATSDGATLVVRAPSAAAARALASALATRRLSGADAVAERRAALRAAAAAELLEGPLPALAPAAECAAALRGRARAWRAVAGPDPGTDAPGPDDARVAAAWAGIEAAAAAADPRELEVALAVAAGAERRRLEREAAGAVPFDPALVARWAARAHRAADALDALATGLEVPLTALQRGLVDDVAPGRALEDEPALPDPAAAFAAAGATPAVSEARPDATALAAHAAGGGVLALAFGLGIVALARPRRPAGGAAPVPAPRGDGLGEAWLHLVSGPRRAHLARGAMELAARATARGERVLVVDAARGARLHRPWGREARLGLVDCFDDRMPVLGLCQHGGLPGLLLLAWGEPGRRAQWTQLDRVIEEARPHFGRVILALAPDTPREVGSMLAGRVMDGWWAAPRRDRARALEPLTERIGIRFRRLDLEACPEASLEGLRARFAALRGAAVPALEANGPVPDRAPAPPAPPLLAAPAVLDCDLQVRERLRFLAWLRRVQAESRHATLEPARRD